MKVNIERAKLGLPTKRRNTGTELYNKLMGIETPSASGEGEQSITSTSQDPEPSGSKSAKMPRMENDEELGSTGLEEQPQKQVEVVEPPDYGVEWTVLWRKQSTKKHKTWGGDGIIVVDGKKLILKNENGDILSTGGMNDSVIEDDRWITAKVGNYEVEFKESFYSGT